MNEACRPRVRYLLHESRSLIARQPQISCGHMMAKRQILVYLVAALKSQSVYFQITL